MRAPNFAVPVLVAALLALAAASASAADPPEEEKKPATFLDEVSFFAYIEQSFTFNMGGAGRGGVNELRVYDYYEDYTFNMAEFSVKKVASERYPFGFGLTVTAGRDAQKNHSLGIFRDEDDAFPFRNTALVDVQEAYVSVRIPVGSGLIVRAGKWASLLGYEVIESPNNLNFSRGYLFNFAGPFTHTGVVANYSPAEWITLYAGVATGSDTTDDNNERPMGGLLVALTPLADLSIITGSLFGPEQNDNNRNQRWILDTVVTYTGLPKTTLAAEITGGNEKNEASLVALDTRRDADACVVGLGAVGRLRLHRAVSRGAAPGVLQGLGRRAHGLRQQAVPLVHHAHPPAQDLARAGRAARVPPRSGRRAGIPQPVRQEPRAVSHLPLDGHDLVEHVLPLLLADRGRRA